MSEPLSEEQVEAYKKEAESLPRGLWDDHEVLALIATIDQLRKQQRRDNERARMNIRDLHRELAEAREALRPFMGVRAASFERKPE